MAYYPRIQNTVMTAVVKAQKANVRSKHNEVGSHTDGALLQNGQENQSIIKRKLADTTSTSK